jgi:hypothetical protein
VHARDQDHTIAWEKYNGLKRKAQFLPPATVIEKLTQVDNESRKPKANDGRAWERTHSFGVTTKLYRGTRRGSSSVRQPNNHKSKPVTRGIKREKSTSESKEIHAVEQPGKAMPSTKHEKKLIKINQVKERLRGQYLRFDIPNGLDDTAARFIMAVAMRYNFACPQESSLHGSFILGPLKKKDQQAALALADPLIQHLNGKGIVFIRQLLPMSHMTDVLSSLNVSEEFIALSSSLMQILHQVTGGNHMSRRYLMSKCSNFLRTQKKLAGPSSVVGRRSEDGVIASRLGEFGAGENYYKWDDDNDIPGGLWATEVTCESEILGGQNNVEPKPIKDACSRKHKTWAVAYTRKVLEENDANHPAYNQYTNFDLLTRNNN